MHTQPMKGRHVRRILSRLSARLHSDDICLQIIEDIRWPNGVKCLKCQQEVKYRTLRTFGASKRIVYAYKCGECGHQFAATTDTIFDRTHVRLGIWFQVLWVREIFRQSGQRLPVLWVVQRYGVTRRTARRMLQRIQLRENDELVLKIGQRRSSKVDPFKPAIARMLRQGEELAILDGLKELGYRGGVVNLRKYVSQLRKRPLYRESTAVVGREWKGYAATVVKARGDYHIKIRSYGKAVRDYEKALKLDPKNPELSELLRRAKNARAEEVRSVRHIRVSSEFSV